MGIVRMWKRENVRMMVVLQTGFQTLFLFFLCALFPVMYHDVCTEHAD